MRHRHLISVALLLCLLAVCNVPFIHSHSWHRALWGALGYIGLYTLYRYAHLSTKDIGLGRADIPKGLRYGGAAVAIVLAVLCLLDLVHTGTFHDLRYRQGIGTALFSGLALVPIQTVVFEELAFRGLLLALLLKLWPVRAWIPVTVSALLFGIWHVSSAGGIGSYRVGSHLLVPKPVVILSTVVFTATAGILFCLLRLRSKSLFAPFLLHWSTNATAIVLAAFSWR